MSPLTTTRRGLTTVELARRAGCPRQVMEHVLREELDRGHVRQDEDGGWAATPLLLRQYGQAFLAVGAEAA